MAIRSWPLRWLSAFVVLASQLACSTGSGAGALSSGGATAAGGRGNGGATGIGGAGVPLDYDAAANWGDAGPDDDDPCSPGTAPIATTDQQTRDRLVAIQRQTRALALDVMNFWREKGPDPVYGGFYGNLDRMGAKSSPTDKGLIQQARHLWTFSNWYERKEPIAAVKKIADGQYDFLTRRFYDAATKQYQYKVNETGLTPVDSRKVLYAESFALYALSTYGRVFSVLEATNAALELFRAIDARHDAKFGGYDEHNDSGWLGSGSMKSTNTHIHLMEAFTALYESGRDPTVKARIEEFIDIVRMKILQPNGTDAQEFTNDWTPNGAAQVSYGHDLETGWLLWRAACVIGRGDDADVRAAAVTMASTSATQGWDATQGAFNENGVPGGAPSSTNKIWWVQSEALESLFFLYRFTGDSTYLDKLEGVLDFLEGRQRDTQYPGTEWFYGIAASGQVDSNGDHKSQEWKCSYHNTRALTYLDGWITTALR